MYLRSLRICFPVVDAAAVDPPSHLVFHLVENAIRPSDVRATYVRNYTRLC